MRALSAGPPPYSLSPLVPTDGDFTVVSPIVLPTPTTLGQGSLSHQPQTDPPDWPGVNSLKWPSTWADWPLRLSSWAVETTRSFPERRPLSARKFAGIADILPVVPAVPAIVVGPVAGIADGVADALVHDEHDVVEGGLLVGQGPRGLFPVDHARGRRFPPTARCRRSSRA